MPLIVAEKSSSTPTERKLRLIHDCRYVNLHLKKWCFKLEQLHDFVKCLKRSSHMIGGLGQCVPPRRYRTTLLNPTRLLVRGRGLHLGGTPFRPQRRRVRLLSPLIDRWRCHSSHWSGGRAHRVRQCRFGADVGRDPDKARAQAVVSTIESFPFLIDWSKSFPSIECLGFILDTELMMYDIPERRLAKLLATAWGVTDIGKSSASTARARSLASLVGQFWSLQTALGLVCRLRSRYILISIIRPAVLDGADEFDTASIYRELARWERLLPADLRELIGYAHSVETVCAWREGERMRGKLCGILARRRKCASMQRAGAKWSRRRQVSSSDSNSSAASISSRNCSASRWPSGGCRERCWATPTPSARWSSAWTLAWRPRRSITSSLLFAPWTWIVSPRPTTPSVRDSTPSSTRRQWMVSTRSRWTGARGRLQPPRLQQARPGL